MIEDVARFFATQCMVNQSIDREVELGRESIEKLVLRTLRMEGTR